MITLKLFHYELTIQHVPLLIGEPQFFFIPDPDGWEWRFWAWKVFFEDLRTVREKQRLRQEQYWEDFYKRAYSTKRAEFDTDSILATGFI